MPDVSIKLSDRFGDHGLVGVAIIQDESETCAIDTFLLSCGSLGEAWKPRCSRISLKPPRLAVASALRTIYPYQENAPARDFYAQHGFQLLEENGDGSIWTFDLQRNTIAIPEWIRLKTGKGERA